MSRPLPEIDANNIRTFLRLGETDPLPQNVLDLYWKFRHLRDRGGHSPTDSDVLAWIVLQAGEEVQPDPEPDPLHEQIRKGLLPIESTIEVQWRNGQREAKYLAYSARTNEVSVILSGEATERWLTLDRVLGQPVEA